MTVTIASGSTINDDFSKIKSALGRSDIQIKNKGDTLIILEGDDTELSSGDQDIVNALSLGGGGGGGSNLTGTYTGDGTTSMAVTGILVRDRSMDYRRVRK